MLYRFRTSLLVLCLLFMFLLIACKAPIQNKGYSSLYPQEIEKAMSGPYQYAIKAVGKGSHADSIIAVKKAHLSAYLNIGKAVQAEMAQLDPFFSQDSIKSQYRPPLGLNYENEDSSQVEVALTVVERVQNAYVVHVLKYLRLSDYMNQLENDIERNYNHSVLEIFKASKEYELLSDRRVKEAILIGETHLEEKVQ